MDIIFEKWDEILEKVKSEYELTDISFRYWLQPLKVYKVDQINRIVTIIVPSAQMGLDYISRKYMFPIKVAIAELTGIDYDILFQLENEISTQEEAGNTFNSHAINTSIERANLNPKYTFDTFVVGSNNKFAHAAALAVAESPGKMYNPLFIYGGAGLGKTHLMHSIANFILTRDPDKNVLYVTSEKFTNDLIDAIRSGNNNKLISSFREKYRSVDVLLIDDIQFIIGKEATQEEFFHTFNDLKVRDKQIIISSDKPPKDMEALETRLLSRFEWGILADISAPDYETRMAILHKKEEEEGNRISPDVMEYMARNIKSNIRELEGALNKLVAMAKLDHREITLELAERELKDIISPDRERAITPELIISTVADHFHISPEDITGNKRSSNIAYPRQIAMYLCRYMIDMSMTDIGAYMGGRDHSTVIYGVKKLESAVEDSESTRQTLDVIRKKVNPNF